MYTIINISSSITYTMILLTHYTYNLHYTTKVDQSKIILPTSHGVYVRVKLKCLLNYRGYMALEAPQKSQEGAQGSLRKNE